jgi:hypothetical protein
MYVDGTVVKSTREQVDKNPDQYDWMSYECSEGPLMDVVDVLVEADKGTLYSSRFHCFGGI